MPETQGPAGVPRRSALLLLATLALGCGGGTEPVVDLDAVGLWDVTMTAQLGLTPPLLSCTIPWVMKIEDLGTPGAPYLETTVPMTARMTCEDGSAGPWMYGDYRWWCTRPTRRSPS